jgi:hypothetical protein
VNAGVLVSGYLYEESDPERFQQLCQALLLEDFPDLQCFPVGQPDGGRDGSTSGRKDPAPTTVLQVKFKRRDEVTDDAAAWMIEALEGERPKIERLADGGTARYLVATNARGTASLDGGSIDRVQHWIDDTLPIPGRVMWRDDIDRRLERSLELQWRYPEVLTGGHAIRLALESRLSEDQDRRAKAISGFVTYQFSKDEHVKFKQVDLSNDLLSLFIDVPASLSTRVRSRLGDAQVSAYVQAAHRVGDLATDNESLQEPIAVYYDPSRGYHIVGGAGTASLLLSDEFQIAFPRVVLEGAPGQGKSTLAQYVCQIHRARYLDRSTFCDSLPANHRIAAVRLPIKVDLRDLSTWLTRRDPFLPGHPDATDEWSDSLESFIARLIRAQSGGIQFSVYDLTTCLEGVPTLLFLDGLDEVADIDARRTLIDAVRAGLERLAAAGALMQVVVTSRPAAFANSPGFSPKDFTYLELLNIPRRLAFDYADKWIVARDLDESDADEVRSILSEKLDLPHIRDLARNPMQLAILLALIHSVGYSLPDERTELYSSYMDKFLTREAEKTPAVRRHRPLLVRLHEHLAWLLQSEAESTAGASGSITPERLRAVLRDYLVEHEHPQDILDDLFTGMLERVYVLVQRIEGAYEFEVQPLREYFAATHLYKTAPPRIDGADEALGTRGERFDAIARNAYWTNVCRFFAGRYTTGELGGLYFQLEELKESAEFRLLFRPRDLAVMLLGDWVFKESPRPTRHVVECVFDDLGLKGAAYAFLTHRHPPVSLPPECGRSDLVRLILAALGDRADVPSMQDLMRLLDANGGHTEFGYFAERIRAAEGLVRSRWVVAATEAGALDRAAPEIVMALLSDDSWTPRQTAIHLERVACRNPELLQHSPAAVDMLIQHSLSGLSGLDPLAPTERSSWVLDLGRLLSLSTAKLRTDDYYRNRFPESTAPTSLASQVPQEWIHASAVLELLAAADEAPAFDWVNTLGAWHAIVEPVRTGFGETWAGYGLATLSAGIRSSTERARGATDLFDDRVKLCERARHARLRRGRADWWISQLTEATNDHARMFWALMVVTWCSDDLVLSLGSELEDVVASLCRDRYDELFLTARETGPFASRRSPGRAAMEPKRGSSDRLSALLGASGRPTGKSMLRRLETAEEQVVRSWAQRRRLVEVTDKTMKAGNGVNLGHVREFFAAFGTLPPAYMRRRDTLGITIEVARRVLSDPLLYPYELVVASEEVLRRRLDAVPIAQVAREARWTFE